MKYYNKQIIQFDINLPTYHPHVLATVDVEIQDFWITKDGLIFAVMNDTLYQLLNDNTIIPILNDNNQKKCSKDFDLYDLIYASNQIVTYTGKKFGYLLRNLIKS